MVDRFLGKKEAVSSSLAISTKKENIMDQWYTYEVWIRINPYQTTNVRIQAKSDFDAKMIAEAQYGVGNVLNYTRID